MYKLIIVLVLSLNANFCFGAGKAQQPQNPQNPFAPKGMELPEVSLSADSVQKLISSFGALRTEFKDYQPSENPQDMQNYMQADQAAFKKAEGIVREAGFKDFAEWSAHFSKVMQTYMAYRMQGAKQASQAQQAQIEKQMQAMQNDPSLTAEQKQMALNMMGTFNMYNQMAVNVPEQDLKTLKPFIGQLEQVLQADDKK